MDDEEAFLTTRDLREEVRMISRKLPELIALAEEIGATETQRWLEAAERLARRLVEDAAAGAYDH